MPADPTEAWDVREWDSRGYTVRLSWFGLTPRFQILGTDLVFSNTFDTHTAISALIKGEEAMQTKQPTPPAPDMLKQRADFFATHLTAIAHLQEIERRREVECI